MFYAMKLAQQFNSILNKCCFEKHIYEREDGEEERLECLMTENVKGASS